MDIAIFIRNEKTNVFVTGLTVRNDRLNDKERLWTAYWNVDVTRKKYVLSTTQTLM